MCIRDRGRDTTGGDPSQHRHALRVSIGTCCRSTRPYASARSTKSRRPLRATQDGIKLNNRLVDQA
eukprot:10021340-Prorocentrum_lima.AAC.1